MGTLKEGMVDVTREVLVVGSLSTYIASRDIEVFDPPRILPFPEDLGEWFLYHKGVKIGVIELFGTYISFNITHKDYCLFRQNPEEEKEKPRYGVAYNGLQKN